MSPMIQKEQEHYIRALERIDEVFRKHNVQYWLDAGTLLCAYRDGDLSNEHDIDIGVYGEDYDKIVSLSEELRHGIQWRISHTKLYHTISIDDLPGSKLHCDVIQWHSAPAPSGGIRTCWGVRLPFCVPSGMLDEFVEIKLEKLSDRKFFAPAQTERYLEMYYGKEDWKVPMEGIDYHNYQMGASKRTIERYEINKNNDACTEFWKQRLGYKTSYLDY